MNASRRSESRLIINCSNSVDDKDARSIVGKNLDDGDSVRIEDPAGSPTIITRNERMGKSIPFIKRAVISH